MRGGSAWIMRQRAYPDRERMAMIKENQKLFNWLNIISDAAASIFAVIAAYFIVFHLLEFDKNFSLSDYIKLSIVFIPIQLITFGCMGLYGSFRTKTLPQELGKITGALVLDGIIMITMLYILHLFNFSRWALFIFLALDLALISLKRSILRSVLRSLRERGYNKKFVLIVGGGEAAREYLETIREDRTLGLECAGYVGEERALSVRRMGGYDDILSVLDKRSYDEVVCALDDNESGRLAEVVDACELTGTKISVIPMIYKYMSSTPSIDVVGGIPVMNIRRIPLDNMGNAFLKRATDIIGSLLLIILTLPVMLASAVVIKLTIGGNVIFTQKRVGLNKRIFTMYKLKSRRDSKESDTAWSKRSDPRRTRFGAFIRKFSIDELPQLFNVLKGDMSLVGPRPEIPYYVNTFKDKIPLYMIKHQVKPGITGLAQVNGYRGDTSIEKRVEFDIRYIENWTYFLDISILLRTLFSFINKEKLGGGKKHRTKRAEKSYMKKNVPNLKKPGGDMTALAIFFPAVLALGIIPILMHVTVVVSQVSEDLKYFKSSLASDGGIWLIDTYSQCKAFAVVLFAIIMLCVGLVCCTFLFRRVRKQWLVVTGMSAVYVLMALISALCSDYSYTALHGVFDRAEGFYTTACYFVIFLFTMYAFRTAGNFKYVVTALFFCVGVNVVIGVFQFTGNDLLNQEWFRKIIIDKEYADVIQFRAEGISGMMSCALYNYNYVGSFTGLVVPLFTTLALFEKRPLYRVLCLVFDAAAVFMLFGSLARSGIVAVAAALVVGIFVFFRIIIKHWKVSLSVFAGAAVVIVGMNFALGGRLLRRIPSIVEDAVSILVPSDNDLFDELPVREINHNKDGSVSFVTQSDAVTVGYSEDEANYVFTDKAGARIELSVDAGGKVTFLDDRFKDITFEIQNEYDDPAFGSVVYMSFYGNTDNCLCFNLFGGKNLHLVDSKTGERVVPQNAEHIGFEGREKVGSSRGYIWSRTLPLLKNCLLIGYGADTFVYNFPQNDYLAKYYSYAEGFNIVVDKPHNLYLQIFYSNGLVALIMFLGICVIYLADCVRLYALKREYGKERIFGVSVMLGIVGYLAAGLFNDSVVSVAPVFWILLGVGFALNAINRKLDKEAAAGETEAAEETDAGAVSKLSKEDEERLALAEKAAPEILSRIEEQKARERQRKYDVNALLDRVNKLVADNSDNGGSGGNSGNDGNADNDDNDGGDGSADSADNADVKEK